MKVKVGDNVKYLNSVGGGRITRIEKDVAYVADKDDFEVPVKVDELLKVESGETIPGLDENRKETATEESEEPEEDDTEANEVFESNDPKEETLEEDDSEQPDEGLRIYLGFIPSDAYNKTNADVRGYLINDSNYFILYNIAQKTGERYESQNVGKLEPNTKYELLHYKREELNDLDNFIVQMIPFKKKPYTPYPAIEKRLHVEPVKFFKEQSYKENDFFEEKAIIKTIKDELQEEINKLTENDFDEVIKEKEVKSKQINTPPSYKKPDKQEQEEVDLHIHELIEDERNLSNQEMLEIQINHFKEKMEEAIKKQLKRIVFIHGIGNGTLKLELRKELARNYSKYTYQDASFAKYGYGATLVHLTK